MIAALETAIRDLVEASSLPSFDDKPDTSTHTIDLDNLVYEDVTKTGTFDLRRIGSTSLGRLMDSLPVPTLIVDERHYIVFANRSCESVCDSYREIQGRPFADLLREHPDSQRQAALTQKAVAVLDRAFTTRKPQKAEAILDFRGTRIWARLHLRSVRITRIRHILVLVEDLTTDRARQRISEREELRLKESYAELENQVRLLQTRLARLSRDGGGDSARSSGNGQSEASQPSSIAALTELAPVGMTVTNPKGEFKCVNSLFAGLFGCSAAKFPNGWKTLQQMCSEIADKPDRVGAWWKSLQSAGPGVRMPINIGVTGSNVPRRVIRVTGMKSANGDYVFTGVEGSSKDGSGA